ncbi:protein FAM76A [Sitodiplosis mosellana]|uniref:protein FAM76A n=1 Tax=Sitodiplosis mosellana TaxID=263140 RepID=UPI002444B2DA|nr:protein FAM76A [Sitodiplosis mosellana]
MSSQVVLFACSKCFSRHPFEELSTGQQLCKDCRGSFPTLKCTYCRSEFQQSNKSSTSTICKKCEYNVKQYGKPSACEYCNIIAAFIGTKCQRCTNSELKYGPAVTCDQCKQRCAFDRHDENKKIDGKLLCWLCTLSFKRALAKARQVETDNRLTKKRPSTDKQPVPQGNQQQQQIKENHKKIQRTDSSKQVLPEIPEKIPRNSGVSIDPNSSDHVVAMTQLKEQIASLQKRLAQKDRDLLAKDKLMTELKSKNFTSENEMRNKMKETEKFYEAKIDVLNKKLSSLLKEVAQLSKNTKKSAVTTASSANNTVAAVKENSGSGSASGSGTDSPTTN